MGKLWEPRERYYARYYGSKLGSLGDYRHQSSRLKKILRQTLVSLLIFLVTWGTFQFESPAMVSVQGKIRNWFTKDYNLEPVLKFFTSVGIWGDTLERAAFEAVETSSFSEPLLVPVSGQIGKSFGWIVQADRSRVYHEGITIIAAEGTPIKAAMGGTVCRISNEEELGRVVNIGSEGGVVIKYAYCKEVLVNLNDEVKAGQVIAKVGKTGKAGYPQLFFSVSIKGRLTDPAQLFLPSASQL
jgi:murein DD-endopeptidase MepM/ murein hydrolase activator NlpD